MLTSKDYSLTKFRLNITSDYNDLANKASKILILLLVISVFSVLE